MKKAWLLGSPLSHSRSPQLHRAAYAQLGQPWSYDCWETTPQQLPSVLAQLQQKPQELLGLNLTIPLKEIALPLAAELTPEAQRLGAINCLRLGPCGWQGHNTDGLGWLDSFEHEIQGRKVLLLGAGGAARALLATLRSQGAGPFVLFNRSPQRAQALLQPGDRYCPWDHFTQELTPNCLVVQTTSVGMWPQVEAQPVEWPAALPPGVIACDLIYNPSPSRWLAQAQERGAHILDGRGMLVHQARRAIHWWSGLLPEPAPMLQALEA